MQNDRDTLRRFVFERASIRGEIVHLDETWRALTGGRRYPEPVCRVLGEATAAASLLAATIKQGVKLGGSLILQLNGSGPLYLLVVQAFSGGRVRGLARWHDPVGAGPLAEMTGAGKLAITIDPGEGRKRYQGIVALRGDSVAQAVGEYFDRSEQLPTRLWLAADASRAAGLLVQETPGESGDDDAWNRSVHLADTVTREELLELDAEALLGRLYRQEDVRLFQGERIIFHCGCDRQRVAEVLHAMGSEDMRELLARQGKVSVDCEYCAARYEFDAVDIEQIFAAGEQPPVSETRH